MTYLSHQHIVLMPGLDGTGKSFNSLLPLISPDGRITIVRYPADRFLSFDETVDSASAQIPEDELQVVIAESFSGPVAMQMVGSGSVKARALILCATYARSPSPLGLRLTKFFHLTRFLRADMPPFFFKLIMGDDETIAALKPLWADVHADIPTQMMDHRLGILSRVDVRDRLAQLSLPCLYLQATADRLVPEARLKELKKGIPHLEVKKIRAPHFVLQAQPHACLEAIEEFLSAQNFD
jgi:pimeloyl-ACP methyl ester carboxylesterase